MHTSLDVLHIVVTSLVPKYHGIQTGCNVQNWHNKHYWFVFCSWYVYQSVKIIHNKAIYTCNVVYVAKWFECMYILHQGHLILVLQTSSITATNVSGDIIRLLPNTCLVLKKLCSRQELRETELDINDYIQQWTNYKGISKARLIAQRLVVLTMYGICTNLSWWSEILKIMVMDDYGVIYSRCTKLT